MHSDHEGGNIMDLDLDELQTRCADNPLPRLPVAPDVAAACSAPALTWLPLN